MTGLESTLKLRQLLAAWSDTWEAEASRFAEAHRDLMPRRITNSQLYGLADAVRGVVRFIDLIDFLENQAGKAERAGRYDVHDFWQQLIRELNRLKSESQTILKEIPEQDTKTGKEILLKQLAEQYVRHLVAHCILSEPAERRGTK